MVKSFHGLKVQKNKQKKTLKKQRRGQQKLCAVNMNTSSNTSLQGKETIKVNKSGETVFHWAGHWESFRQKTGLGQESKQS